MKKVIFSMLCIGCMYIVSFSQVDTISYNIYQLNGNLGIGNPPGDIYSGIHIASPNAVIRLEDTDETAGDIYQIINNTKGNDVQNLGVYDKTDERCDMSFDGEGNVSILYGNAGFGMNTPQSRIQVAEGDVYISDINFGIIMKSPDGNCWKGTIDNYGQLNFVLMEACPDDSITTFQSEPGISQIAEVLIYPNPAHSKIFIELPMKPSSKTSLNISNTNGQQLITLPITDPKTEIDISHLPVGTYIIKVWNNNDVMVQKVIKE